MNKRRKSSGTAKKKRLEAAVQAIQLKWGSQMIQRGASSTTTSAIPSLPTGLPNLDGVLSIGGLPLGHIVELIGQPTSGKRTLALHILSQAQKRHACLYIDLAQTFDPAYAASCRIDLGRLILAAPGSASQALDLACELASGGHFGLIVFDSTAELRTGSWPPGIAETTLRRLRQSLNGKQSTLLFLTTPLFDQIESLDNYPPGFELGQHAALRLAVSRHRWLRRSGAIRGYQAQITVLRNRWGQEGQRATVQVVLNGVHLSTSQD